MNDHANFGVSGHIEIRDHLTRELLLSTHNDVLYGNMSTALAHSLVGNSSGLLCYLALGNGGAYVGPTGTISYKPSLGGIDSLVKNPNANLYNTVYVRKLSTAAQPFASNSRVTLPTENYATNYEDIQVSMSMDYNEPPVGSTDSVNITQLEVDNSGFVGSVVSRQAVVTVNPGELVFNELGLFAGTANLFSGASTSTAEDLTSFITQKPNFSTDVNNRSKLMITHAIFHPVQKAANRAIDIIYTLRIQMGALARLPAA